MDEEVKQRYIKCCNEKIGRILRNRVLLTRFLGTRLPCFVSLCVLGQCSLPSVRGERVVLSLPRAVNPAFAGSLSFGSVWQIRREGFQSCANAAV